MEIKLADRSSWEKYNYGFNRIRIKIEAEFGSSRLPSLYYDYQISTSKNESHQYVKSRKFPKLGISKIFPSKILAIQNHLKKTGPINITFLSCKYLQYCLIHWQAIKTQQKKEPKIRSTFRPFPIYEKYDVNFYFGFFSVLRCCITITKSNKNKF